MTDGYIPVQNAGKNLHTKVRQTSDGAVHDEVVSLSGVDDAGAIKDVGGVEP